MIRSRINAILEQKSEISDFLRQLLNEVKDY